MVNNNLKLFKVWGGVGGGGGGMGRNKNLLAPMGVLAPGSAQTCPSAHTPIDTSRIFVGTVVFKVTFKHTPEPPGVIPKVLELIDNF